LKMELLILNLSKMENYEGILTNWVLNMDKETQKNKCIEFGLIAAYNEKERVKEMYAEINKLLETKMYNAHEVSIILKVVQNPIKFE